MNARKTTTESALPEILMSKRDCGHIERMLGGRTTFRRSKVIDDLEREIARAVVVDDDRVPSETVTMDSRVLYRDEDTGREHVATLVYPNRPHEAEDAVSLFTPVGVALLGLSEGQSIAYETPDGRIKTLTAIKVLAQATERRAVGG